MDELPMEEAGSYTSHIVGQRHSYGWGQNILIVESVAIGVNVILNVILSAIQN